MLKVITGVNRLLADELTHRVGQYLASEDRTEYVIVPRQITLLIERMLIDRLHLQGSFRLQVLSPARLCLRIFDDAGVRDSIHVDDRGRVMLVRRLMRENESRLTIYRGHERRRGFCEKCAAQLELFVQGGMTAELLRECARDTDGTARMKLDDLAVLLEVYSECMQGRYRDGETDLIRACERVTSAFAESSRFLFFGFDLMPPTLTGLIARLSLFSDAELLLPLKPKNSPDAQCFGPIRKTLERLCESCLRNGIRVEEAALTDQNDTRPEDLIALEEKLYAFDNATAGEAKNIRIVQARDPREECMYAAAYARRMAMQGCRWADIQVLCDNMDSYGHILSECFALYGVPLFLSASRPVSRIASAECLLTALKLIERGWHTEDVFTLIRTGYTGISRRQGELLANYAINNGIDRGKWKRAFTRGDEKKLEEMNRVRERVTEPVLRMEHALRKAETLQEQLTAVYGYLQDIGAYKHSLHLQNTLNNFDLREEAGRLSQAWNRIIGTLDQMSELLGEMPLELAELSRTLSDALDASDVKVLPQSADAVSAQGTTRLLQQRAKLLIFIGMTDSGAAGGSDLLTDEQKSAVARKTHRYLGPSVRDNALLKQFYLKSALGMADGEVIFSYPLSGTDDSARRPSVTMNLIRSLFSSVPTVNIRNDADARWLLRSAPSAAAALIAGALSDLREGEKAEEEDAMAVAALRTAGETLPELKEELARLGETAGMAEPGIGPELARELYGEKETMSVTRLETFADCPFAYFIKYGLMPEKVQAPELRRTDIGDYLHNCMRDFLRKHGDALREMEPDEAASLMGPIADSLLAQTDHGDAPTLEAAYASMRENALECARALAVQMHGSRFLPSRLEQSFGPDDPEHGIRVGDTLLEGRIDRVDSCASQDAVRVLDYKLSGKTLDPTEVFNGHSLQLPVYLRVAMEQSGGKSAGMYYFPLSDGIVDEQTTDRNAIEKKRMEGYRLQGMLPDTPELVHAMAPVPELVFGKVLNSDDTFAKNAVRASDADFDRLLRHTLRMAQQQMDGIRSGKTDAAPAVIHAGAFDEKTGCGYCAYRAACLVDRNGGFTHPRRMKKLSWDEVFMKLIEEETPQTVDASQTEESHETGGEA